MPGDDVARVEGGDRVQGVVPCLGSAVRSLGKVLVNVVVDHVTRDHESQEADAIKQDAEDKEAESLRAESRALRFDLGEGLLELGLVLCSLYFLSRKKSFPAFGIAAAILGVVLGASGFLI